jgi:hypothetical protein
MTPVAEQIGSRLLSITPVRSVLSLSSGCRVKPLVERAQTQIDGTSDDAELAHDLLYASGAQSRTEQYTLAGGWGVGSGAPARTGVPEG